MRLIVIDQASDLQTALRSSLVKKPAGGKSKAGASEVSQATLDQVKRLNPHVEDFQHLEAGAALLLPDAAELNARDSLSLDGIGFEAFAAHASEGFKAVAQRMRLSAEALAGDRAAVNAVLKIAAVTRQIDSDQLRQKQLDEANSEFADAQKKAQEAASQVEAMQKEMGAELEALRYTPVGLPALNLKLDHESEVQEAGQTRQVKLSVKSVAFAAVAERLVKQVLGSKWRLSWSNG